jgi:hypothetical protein
MMLRELLRGGAAIAAGTTVVVPLPEETTDTNGALVPIEVPALDFPKEETEAGRDPLLVVTVPGMELEPTP